MVKRTEREQKEYEDLMKLSIKEINEKIKMCHKSIHEYNTPQSRSNLQRAEAAQWSAINENRLQLLYEVLKEKEREKEELDKLEQEYKNQKRDEEMDAVFKEIKSTYKKIHPLRYLSLKILGTSSDLAHYHEFERQALESRTSVQRYK